MRGSCRGGSWSSASWEEMARAYRRGEERKDTERRLGVGGIARTRGAVSCSLSIRPFALGAVLALGVLLYICGDSSGLSNHTTRRARGRKMKPIRFAFLSAFVFQGQIAASLLSILHFA